MNKSRLYANLRIINLSVFMKFVLKKLLISLLSIHFTTYVIPAFAVNGGFTGLFISTVVLAALIYLIRPVLNIILLPLRILTFNMLEWMINIIIIFVWIIIVHYIQVGSWLFPGLSLLSVEVSPVTFTVWQTTVICAIIIVSVRRFLDWILS